MTDDDGYITANVGELENLVLRLGLSRKRFIEHAAVAATGSGLSSTTGYNIFNGKRVQIGSLKKLLKSHGVPDFERYVAREGSSASEYVAKATMTLDEWNVTQAIGPVQTFANGLQYRLHRLEHKILPNTWGRGKSYDLSHESTEDVERHAELLIRHPKVCRQLAGSPYVPMNERVVQVPGTHIFWVIDRWESGEMLETVLRRERFPKAKLPRVMTCLAEALADLHRHGIIRRDLSPENVFSPR